MRMDALRTAWNELPLVTMDGMLGGRVPVIIAPHPDDESMGCGGLIAQLCAAGTPPHVVILTDGCLSHPNSRTHPPEKLRQMREDEARDALHILGLPHGYTWFLGHADHEMPSVGPAFQFAARRIAGICENQGCNLVISTWKHDPHPDHLAAATLAEHVAVRGELPLLSYPISGWALPDDAQVDEAETQGYRLDISGQIDLKQKAIMTHATQYGDLIQDCQGHRGEVMDLILATMRRPVETFLISLSA